MGLTQTRIMGGLLSLASMIVAATTMLGQATDTLQRRVEKASSLRSKRLVCGCFTPIRAAAPCGIFGSHRGTEKAPRLEEAVKWTKRDTRLW